MAHRLPILLLPLLLAVAPAAPGRAADAQQFEMANGATATVYGQLDLMFLDYDDGAASVGEIVDNNNSTSRVGLTLDWPMPNDAALKFNFETALGFFQSNTLTIAGVAGQDWFDWNEEQIRKVELSYKADFGTIWAGQGSMATDGIAEIDLSRTTPAGFSDYQGVAGGFAFRDVNGVLSGIKVKDAFSNADGSRRMRLRYDTPDFDGLVFSVAYGDEILKDDTKTYLDAGAKYQKTFGDVKFAAGLGYNVARAQDGSTAENLIGSMSALHEPTGLNLTVALGDRIDGGGYVYGKIGWIADFWSVGPTALAVEYFRSNDLGHSGSGDSWGVMAVQTLTDASTEAYVGYRSYEIETDTVDYLASGSFVVGARWKF